MLSSASAKPPETRAFASVSFTSITSPGWMHPPGPAISVFSFTLMSQPSDQVPEPIFRRAKASPHTGAPSPK